MKYSLNTRLVLIFFIAFVVFSVITVFVNNLLLLPKFASLERDHVRDDIQRVVDSIDNELNHLSLLTADWAIWDDTYEYIHDHNSDYEESNLGPSTFEANKINLILYLNESGESIWSKTVSSDFETVLTIPPFEKRSYSLDFPFRHFESKSTPFDEQHTSGLIMTSIGAMLCSAKPILNSEGEGPPRGTLVMGRFLSEQLAGKLSKLTKIDFSLKTASHQDRKIEADPKTTEIYQHEVLLQTFDDVVVATTTLYDIYQKPALEVVVSGKRNIYQQGLNALAISFGFTLICTSIVLTVMMLVLNRSVLRPVRELSIKVTSWGDGQGFEANEKHFGAAQEISDLATEFKRLVSSLENQKTELGTTNLSLIRKARSLKEAESQLKRLDLLKNEFISTAAHELRTPIASVMGYVELLTDPEMSKAFNEDQQKDFLAEIYSSSERLTKIVDDILDISRIELGQKIPLEKKPVNIVEMLKKSINQFNLKCSHALSLEVSPDVPKAVDMDEFRIVQVMENILSNAIKYSSPGSDITTVVELDGRYCRFSVTDHGIGMTEEQAARIFEKFYRVDASDTAVGGLGLGMSIAKQIVEEHGGTIGVQSIQGEGSTVSFTLLI